MGSTTRPPVYHSTPPGSRQFQTAPPLLSENLFRGLLIRERRRTDRSDKPLTLVLVALQAPAGTASAAPSWRKIVDALNAARRETDVLGWFETDRALGVVLPEVPASNHAFAGELKDRIRHELLRRVDGQTANRISIRLHIYPCVESAEVEALQRIDPIVGRHSLRERRLTYRDLGKRLIDVVLSLALLAILSPLLLLIATLVKLTSSGPVLFRQQRVGHAMKLFTMLKFRTMEVNADEAIHYQFISSFIRSRQRGEEAGETRLFKIADDPRVTPIGRMLRTTSMDELPQLWNVLRGDMSLVGPRPPLPYEVEQYKSWHRRRLLEAKPGVTGLWQVTGRSRTTFDGMVRLDLRYARTYSLWTDLKLLLATPRAVISGKGAC